MRSLYEPVDFHWSGWDRSRHGELHIARISNNEAVVVVFDAGIRSFGSLGTCINPLMRKN